MLAVPTKKSKRADWGAPLRQYIAASYGEKIADEQTESLAKLNQAREWVLSNTKKTDEQSLEQVKSYLRMLGAVEARFPIRETHVNITFTWYDSFKPSKKFMHHRVEAERAGVLFNYAAMHSYAGMVQDRSTTEGNQEAVTHFLTAATYFSYLRDTYMPQKAEGPFTSDMSTEGLTMLTNLMLAQTQVCIFEKAIRSKMSPGVLSKIASGAKQLYYNALVATTSGNLSEIIDQAWSDHITFQMRCLEASACYHYSKVILEKAEETGEGYGTRIGYLTQAQGYCDKILKNSEKLLPGQNETINSLKSTIGKDLSKAVTDNNTIYMDMIPDASTLEAPAAHILAKIDLDKIDPLLVGPILPGEKFEGNPSGSELFSELLPAEVQVAVAMFKSRISNLVEKATKIVNENANSVKDALAGANLPATIEAGGGARGLPDATWAKVLEHVHQKGGVSGLKSTLLSNGKLSDQLNAILYEAQQRLTLDESNDMKNRQIWGDRWALPTAVEANTLVKKDLARFKGLLTEAKESDRLLLLKLDSAELGSVLQDVSKGKAALDKLMPDPGMVDDDAEVEGLRSKLRMSYINLQTHLQTVQSKLDGFIYNTSKANIIGDLYRKDKPVNDVVSNENEIQGIIETKIAFYEAPYGEVEKLAEENTAKLSRVLTDNSNYLAARRENAATKESENALKRIEFGIQKFTELHRHISEGKKFYATLGEKVEKLRIMVADHCMTRDMLSREMEQNLARGNNGGGFVHQAPMTTMTVPVNHSAAQPSQAPSFFNTAAVQPVPVVVAATPKPQPAGNTGGLSTYEQLKLAQEQAEKQGTLDQFAGAEVTAGGGGNPAPTQQDDLQAAQTALALEQEEILNRIRTRAALKESKKTDFTKELNEVKALLGTEYPDKLILSHLKVNQGNVGLTVSNLLDNVAPKTKKKGRGMFGFGRKKNKNTNQGGPVVPATNNNSTPVVPGGGGNVW